MEDAKKKGKEKESRSTQQNSAIVLGQQATGSSPPVQQPSSPSSPPSNLDSYSPEDSSIPPSSLDLTHPPWDPCYSPTEPCSSLAAPELVQEAKRLKIELGLIEEETPSSPAKTSSGTRIPIPPASKRPLYNPRSGRPPRPPPSPQQVQLTQLSIGSPNSDPVTAEQQAVETINAAQLSLRLQTQRAKKIKMIRHRKGKRKIGVDRSPFIRAPPGPSPLRPGPSPYEKVKSVVSEIKDFLHLLTSTDSSKKSQQPIAPANPSSDVESDKVTASSSSSSSSSQAPVAPGSSVGEPVPTLEKVVDMLDEYLKNIPSTVSAQEMEDLLQEFQINVEVDPLPTWYSLMRKSNMAFWDSLLGYFSCEALESDLGDGEDDIDDDDAAAGSGSSPPSAPVMTATPPPTSSPSQPS